MTETKLDQQHWLDQLGTSNDVIMTQQQIGEFNHAQFDRHRYLVNPLLVSATLSKKHLLKKITSISKTPTSARFYHNGTALTAADYRRYHAMLNVGVVDDSNTVNYGLITKRAALRTFPTLDKIYKRGKDRDLDRFQESGVFPGEAVAILHTSTDKQWSLVQNYHYIAWMKTDSLAVGSNEKIKQFVNKSQFIVVTGAIAHTTYVPRSPQISNVQLDMGTRLPLADSEQFGDLLYEQNTYANYIVEYPTRNDDGSLEIVLAPIAKSQDVNIGYLPYTHKNVIKQAFKFLGERYGWGHDYNGRDCTGFVGEVYKSFGIKMPRNSGQQGKGIFGQNTRFDSGADNQQKLSVISSLTIGDLIYINGHVMMYIGQDNGQPYIIHDVHGLSYFKPDGELYRGKLNGVSVTPLLPLRLSKNTSYLDKIYNIKQIVHLETH